MTTDTRLEELTHWLQHSLGWNDARLEVASSDASFRRYFRVFHAGQSYIAMDAPPDKEDTGPFIDVTQRLLATGVHVPEIFAEFKTRGFLIIEDLGDATYLRILTNDNVDELYSAAFDSLVKIQAAGVDELERFDSKELYNDLAMMPEWFLEKHLNISLDDEQRLIIEQSFAALMDAIEEQPQIFVHRDYHSRNLLVTPHNNPGIIDHQDALLGPATYDLASLLRDCYIGWPVEWVEKWALHYRDMAQAAGVIPLMGDDDFLRYFDLTGFHRHVASLGAFCLFYYRDGKPGYFNDLPRTLSYVLTVGNKHPETQALIQLFTQLGVPDKIGAHVKTL